MNLQSKVLFPKVIANITIVTAIKSVLLKQDNPKNYKINITKKENYEKRDTYKKYTNERG